MIAVGKIYCGRSSTGVGIGTMRPDRFWQDYAFGHIRDRRFAITGLMKANRSCTA